jgi:hypothetical protein
VAEIKVTDKRMFTPDGRLREEFEQELAAAAAAQEPPVAAEPAPSPAVPEPVPEPTPEPAPEPAAAPALNLPPAPEQAPPGLLELVEFLSGWALACMGDVPLPDGRLARDLDGARFYIDLLGALHERFGKRLGAQELHFVESYLDQLRLRYVSRRG